MTTFEMNGAILVKFELPVLEADEYVKERDARYGKDHFFGEPHNEPVTVKLTRSMKDTLIEFAKAEGYTNLSVVTRELILLGIEYYPIKAGRS